MEQTAKSNRIRSFEQLRLVAMFMVLLLHFVYQSGALAMPGTPLTPTRVMGGLVESFCVVAVNVYVLISGYFLCKAPFKLERVIRLLCEILFYTLLIPAVLKAAGVPVYGTDLWKAAAYILPISMNHYWFATAYVIMVLFSPLLNAGIRRLTRKQLKLTILLLLVFFCLLPSISPVQLVTDQAGYDFGWFLVLYLIAGYIRDYGVPLLDQGWHRASGEEDQITECKRAEHNRSLCSGSIKRAGLCYGMSCFLIFTLYIALQLINERTGGLQYYAGVPFHYNTILCLTGAVSFFCLFRYKAAKEQIQYRQPAQKAGPMTAEKQAQTSRTGAGGKENESAEGSCGRLIRKLSPLTFGVYLIHQHVDIRDRWYPWLASVFGGVRQAAPLTFLLRALLGALLVYVVCLLIDACRQALFRLVGRMVSKSAAARWCRRADALFARDQAK